MLLETRSAWKSFAVRCAWKNWCSHGPAPPEMIGRGMSFLLDIGKNYTALRDRSRKKIPPPANSPTESMPNFTAFLRVPGNESQSLVRIPVEAHSKGGCEPCWRKPGWIDIGRLGEKSAWKRTSKPEHS